MGDMTMPAGPDCAVGPDQLSDEARWQAVAGRDAAMDGLFVYCVRTTGIYCRPSCPSRLARRENVSFHRGPREAEAAGFRPCRKCRPQAAARPGDHTDLVAAACRAIEAAETPPPLARLAAGAGLGADRFRRVFKAVTGLTPKAYADFCRAARMRAALGRGEAAVTSAIYEAGFNSNARFYETSDRLLGMKPTQFRAGGEDVRIHFAVGECSLGSILVARTGRGVCAILIGDDPDALLRDLQHRFPRAELVGGDAGFEEVVARVVGFVEAPGLGLDLPLDIRGTAFQQRVWRALGAIPVGETANYAEIARRIGAPQSVRAVAGACAANPLAVAIPCHRVVRSDGGLSGYRWGVERKRALLEREAAAVPTPQPRVPSSGGS